jgi:alpha/beta superfamily hydrolase
MRKARIVTFANRDGMLLRGMLHEPDPQQARGVCLLLLSPGIKGRVGPHRLYLKIAERLVPMGFHVLRFDFYGLGDSEGEIDERLLSDMYNTIQNGRYIDDTIAAMDWMTANCGVGRFIGSGLCGGSITALLVAAQDRRIESMLALSIPTAFDGGEANWARFATNRQLVGIRRGYFKRIIKPEAWIRFLTGKTSYFVLWRSLKQLIPWANSSSAARLAPSGAATAPSKDDTNPKFAPAFLRIVGSKRPLLLIFSGGDRLSWEFEEKFEARHRDQLEPLRSYLEIKKIADANHALTDPSWVQEMLDMTVDWLDRVHPARQQSIRPPDCMEPDDVY